LKQQCPPEKLEGIAVFGGQKQAFWVDFEAKIAGFVY
jgi:hypothetical protein